MKKTFTLSEVQTMLPVLEALLLRAQDAGRAAGTLEAVIEELRQRIFVTGGMHVDVAAVARSRAEQGAAVEQAKASLAEIEAIGAELHDLGEGLLDLPYRTEGGEVMLCWRIGEPTVTHWHPSGDETPERLPLDERFGRGERERLN